MAGRVRTQALDSKGHKFAGIELADGVRLLNLLLKVNLFMNAAFFRSALLSISCALTLWASSASAALVTASAAQMEGRSSFASGFSYSLLNIPGGDNQAAESLNGGVSISSNHSIAGNVTSLHYTSNHDRRNSGAPSASVLFNQSLVWLQFSVDQAATYSLSGFMSVNDPVSGAGPTYGKSSLEAYLIDITGLPTITTLIYSQQSATSVEDASFVLGESGLTGSLTGALQAGRTYEFQYKSRTETPVNTVFGSMTAFSDMQLQITAAVTQPPVTPVPEPGSLALTVAAALAYAATRRR